MTTYTVTSLADSGTGSLRDMLSQAKDGDTVVFAPGLAGTIQLQSGLSISSSVDIVGNTNSDNTPSIVIQGSGAASASSSNGFSTLAIGIDPTDNAIDDSNPTVSISNIEFADGYDKGLTFSHETTSYGTPAAGAIDNAGNLTITNDVFLDNQAVGGSSASLHGGLNGVDAAGAILNFGSLTVSNTSFQGNGGQGGDLSGYGTGGSGGSAAGGIYNETDPYTGVAATLLLDASTLFSGNTGVGGVNTTIGGDGNDNPNGTGYADYGPSIACYCPGTMILTETGQVAVEQLAIGGRLQTVSGAMRAIRWIGRRSYSAPFARGNQAIWPVRFLAGSLADGVPARDLLVSPKHALFVDGVLIPAEHLVNGLTIRQDRPDDVVAYVHVELDSHDVILAENAPAESFVEDDNRGMFHNAAEYPVLYPEAHPTAARYCAPRIEHGELLDAVRERLRHRAVAACAAAPVGSVEGYLDHADHDTVRGWAFDPDSDAPVRLRLFDNGCFLAEFSADRLRRDLVAAGIGNGHHGFAFDIPGRLAAGIAHDVEIRPVGSSTALRGSPMRIAAIDTTEARHVGQLDGVTRDRIFGWARDRFAPDGAVALDVLDNGVPIARVLANVLRPDLAASRIGNGRHAFELVLPEGLSPLHRHVIQVRCVADGTELANSPLIIEASNAFGSGLERAIEQAVAAIEGSAASSRVVSFLLEQADRARQDVATRATASPTRRAWLQRHRRGPDSGTAMPVLRALVIDGLAPVEGRDAGSAAILSHMRALQALGYEVCFAAADASDPGRATRDALARANVDCCTAPLYGSVEEVLRRQARGFDLVYLHRIGVAADYLSLVRRHQPRARVLYSVADLHHLRIARQAQVEQRPELMALAGRYRTDEIAVAVAADAVLTHSPVEASLLRRLLPADRVHVVPWAVPAHTDFAALQGRQGVLFVGGYGHEPNVDAACWLVEAVMPIVWRKAPDLRCLLVGSAMPPAIHRLARPGVELHGGVPDLDPLFDRVRLSVAPLRFGAGIKGKVLESMAAGVPCVMTPIAAEGLPLDDVLCGLVGTDATALAELILRLHHDDALHQAASQSGLDMIRRETTEARVIEALQQAIGATAGVAKSGSQSRRQA